MKNKGITLIALVITIIVLLILAGVSIATLTGENGIITKAQEAKELTEKAEIDEQLRLAQLSAKLKKQGGSITIEDLKGELQNQGIDFDVAEEDSEIVVEGKYTYDFTEEDGEIAYEYQGTVSKPKPKIVSIEIVEKTDTTIKIKVKTLRNEGGKLQFYIQEEGKEYTLLEDSKTDSSSEKEYTFNIDKEKTYIKIKVEVIAENGETASKEIDIINIPTLTDETIELNYAVNEEKIEQNEWTKGPITVTVSVKNIDTEKYTLQTSKDEQTWVDGETASQIVNKVPIQTASRARTRSIAQTTTQTSSQTFEANGTLYARLKDNETQQTGRVYKKDITHIDTTKPNSFVPEATSTTNSITLKGKTEDGTTTDESASSGIEKYYFAIAEGEKDSNWKPEKWEPEEGITAIEGQEASHTFNNNITQTKKYSLKMKAVDKAGNETETETISEQTGNVPMLADAEFSYEPSEPTNTNVKVTITPKEEISQYKIQYKTSLQGKEGESLEWKDYPEGGITVTRNQEIYARLADSTNQAADSYATGNVKNIYWLAKDVLKTNEEASRPEEKSPYVKYNDKLYRVLYNDESHGLQIISDQSVEKVALGKNDPNVSASEFNYNGSAQIDDNFRKAAVSYNKAVDTLNNKAKEYMLQTDKQESTENKIAIEARCLGSNPLFHGDISEMRTEDPLGYMAWYEFLGLFKDADTEHEADIKQLNSLDLNNSDLIWLASRSVTGSYNSNEHLGVRLLNEELFPLPYTYPHTLIRIEGDGQVANPFFDGIAGFRPVFKISESAKIKSGNYDGLTPERAFEFEGGIESSSPATADEVNAKIGQVVSDYTEALDKVGTWRVFYANDIEMFLISSNTIGADKAFASETGIPLESRAGNKYTGAVDVFGMSYGSTYNAMWKNTKSTDDKERSKATAYLCDPNNWTEYVKANATYAVGGPTKELLVLSWNKAVKNGGQNAPTMKAEWDNADVSADGYQYDKPDALYKNDPILETILPNATDSKGLYNNGSTYWLASPSSNYAASVCFVSLSGHVEDDYYNTTSFGARPIVSIPMSKVQIENGTVKIKNNQ